MEHQSTIVEEIERRRQVDVPAIERELTELWKVAAQSDEGKNAVMRVCLLNLLIFTSDPETTGELSSVVAKVTEQSPCRAIIMIGDKTPGESHTSAWIASHCHLDDKMRQVCCEEIRVSAGGDGLNNLGRTVAPLIVPDLPIFLWWLDAKTLNERYFQAFIDEVNRIIVDTRSLTHLDGEFAALTRFIHTERHRAAFSDLSWTRLTNWRNLIAGLFDAPTTRQNLDTLTKVVIRYAHDGATEGVPVRALLLASWLSGQLRWKLKDAHQVSSTALEFRFRTGKSRLQLEILPQTNSGFPQNDIVGVELTSGRGDGAHFAVTRKFMPTSEHENLFETTAAIAGGSSYSRTVSLPHLNDANLVSREVEIFGRDRAYERAIKQAIELITEVEADAKLVS
jgi:glucose-6-phosphate dehydrogenase assembly protein OpcA